MFTDIKNFTTFSEQLPPNELASALGRYLEVMARIIQSETGGTIDKYIGDAIMTLWNAPEPVPAHAEMACLAALRCREAGRILASSPEWKGLPAFETRFGLHTGSALVGHFGAPDRMNYTGIGDAINLASRLESLNKQYGTAIIASASVVEKARHRFAFRLLDIVAVKGKSEAIEIYELLGEKGEAGAAHGCVAAYEEAFSAFTRRDFTRALAILERWKEDGPSVALAERCRAFQDGRRRLRSGMASMSSIPSNGQFESASTAAHRSRSRLQPLDPPQDPRVFPRDAAHDIAGMHLLGKDVEGVRLDLEMRAEAAAQLVQKIRRERGGGGIDDPRAGKEERHMEMDAQFLDIGKIGQLLERLRADRTTRSGRRSGRGP